jgi:Ran GTPase-activating protein (RanGAP) involved in mRNA processing and transport
MCSGIENTGTATYSGHIRGTARYQSQSVADRKVKSMAHGNMAKAAAFVICLAGGCSGDSVIEPEVTDSQKPVYEQLQKLDASVELDADGNIVSVALSGEQIGNEDIEIFRDVETITELNLSGTGITNDGLEQLETMSQLKMLEIADTKVTRNGVEKLKSDLPNCAIISDFDDEDDE